MSFPDLQAPQPIEMVDGDDARSAIDAAEGRLADLERQAAEATAAADLAEQDATDAGGDLTAASPWSIIRLKRFLDGLREENEAEVTVMLETTHAQARARIEEARAQADAIRGSGPDPASRPTAAPTPPETRGPGSAPVAPSPADSPAPPEFRAFEPMVRTPFREPAPSAAVSMIAMPPTTEPASNGHSHDADTTPEPPIPEPPKPAEPTPFVPVVAAAPAELKPAAPVIAAALAVPEFRPDPQPHAEVAAPDGQKAPVLLAEPPAPAPVAAPEFAPLPGRDQDMDTQRVEVVGPVEAAPVAETSNAKPRRRFLRALPLSAILELLAIVLVLVFILARLG